MGFDGAFLDLFCHFCCGLDVIAGQTLALGGCGNLLVTTFCADSRHVNFCCVRTFHVLETDKCIHNMRYIQVGPALSEFPVNSKSYGNHTKISHDEYKLG